MSTEAVRQPRAGAEQRSEALAAERRRRPEARTVLLWTAVVLIMLFCLFPFYWLINTSLKTGADLSSASLVPPNPTLENFKSIFENPEFTKALRNSVLVTGVTTLIALIVGSTAGYALARLKFPAKFAILALILSITTFPPIAIAAPVYKLFTDIELFNKWYSLILPSLTFALPLAVYILTSFFRDIPRELEEAALVDGATYFQAFRKVVIPLAAPGLVTAGLLVGFFVWNEFLFAITLTSTEDARTVPAAIAFFTGSVQFEQPLGTISAASVVVMIPLVLLVLFFQKRIVAGLTAGAVKG